MKKETNFDKFLTSSYGVPILLFGVLLFWLCVIMTAQNNLKKSYQTIFQPDELQFADICLLDKEWDNVCRKTESHSYPFCCGDERTYRLWKKQNQIK